MKSRLGIFAAIAATVFLLMSTVLVRLHPGGGDGKFGTTFPALGNAGGDLDGNFPNPTVAKLQGNAVSATAPTATTQALMWNGSAWAPTVVSATASGAAGGDLDGSYPNPTVAQLQGQPVSAAAPTATTQALVWNRGAWAPATMTGPPTGAAGGDLTGTYPNPTINSITGDAGTIAVNTTAASWGTNANSLVTDNLARIQVDAAAAATAYTFAVSAATLFTLTAKVACRDNGNGGDAYYGEIQGTYQRFDGGAPVIVGSTSTTSTVSTGGGSAIAIALTVSSNNVIATVTGINAKLYNCVVQTEVVEVQ